MITTGLFLIASPAWPQDDTPFCREETASDVIHIAICEGNAEDQVLIEQGQRICGTDLPCGVWFWTDIENAPVTAPENHDGLNENQVVSALGVFVAEQEAFYRIESGQ